MKRGHWPASEDTSLLGYLVTGEVHFTPCQ